MATARHLLIVEDHDALRESLVEVLEGAGYHVTAAGSAEAVTELPAARRHDIAILDLNLPGEDGLTLAARLRRTQPGIGIVMLTARAALADKLAGYDSGADIYLPKPVAPQELLATLEALARRIIPAQQVAAHLKLDLAGNRLHGPTQAIALAEAESALLRAFALALEGRLETWQVLEILGEEKTSRTALEIRISRLRKKLAAVGVEGETLRAIRGQGYRLLVELTIA